VNADVPMAANGVLLFELRSSGLPVSSYTITVMLTESAGASVRGTVENLALTTTNRYRIFRPANSLTSGKSYVATALASGAGTSMLPFMATGAVPSGAPEVAFGEPAFAVNLRTVSQECCEYQAGARGPQPCIVTEAQQQAMLTFKPTWSNPSAARQFLYRLVLTDPAPAIENTYWMPAQPAGGITVVAEAEADEYCYRIEAFGLVDGARHVLTEACAPNALPPLERVSPTATDIRDALDIWRCGLPPTGFLESWCEQNRFTCTGTGSQAPCTASKYAQRCAGTAGASGAGGAAGTGASGQSGRAGAGPAGGAGNDEDAGGTSTGDEADDAPEHRTSGCGCRVGSSASASWLAVTMFVVLTSLLCVRRRQRIARDS
jgi:hypothetical protein